MFIATIIAPNPPSLYDLVNRFNAIIRDTAVPIPHKYHLPHFLTTLRVAPTIESSGTLGKTRANFSMKNYDPREIYTATNKLGKKLLPKLFLFRFIVPRTDAEIYAVQSSIKRHLSLKHNGCDYRGASF